MMAISFSKRPRPDGCPLFSPRMEVWAVSHLKSSWRKTFSEKFKFHFERIIVQYLCCLQSDFVRIHRTWSLGTDMMGSARHQDVLRVRFSVSWGSKFIFKEPHLYFTSRNSELQWQWWLLVHSCKSDLKNKDNKHIQNLTSTKMTNTLRNLSNTAPQPWKEPSFFRRAQCHGNSCSLTKDHNRKSSICPLPPLRRFPRESDCGTASAHSRWRLPAVSSLCGCSTVGRSYPRCLGWQRRT